MGSKIDAALNLAKAGFIRGKNIGESVLNKGISKFTNIAKDVQSAGYSAAAQKHAGGLMTKANDFGERWINQGTSGKIVDKTIGLIDVKENGTIGFSGSGKALLFGVGTLAIGFNTWNAIDDRDMGTTDGTVMRATPSIRSYLQNPQQAPGGADGSLVFAMHNNRHRGYL